MEAVEDPKTEHDFNRIKETNGEKISNNFPNQTVDCDADEMDVDAKCDLANQSSNQPAYQSANQSGDQPADQSADQPADLSVNQSDNRSSDSVNEDNVTDSPETRGFDSISTFLCFVCRSARARYRCPGCETPSCSLLCVRKHKKILECDGTRNKVKYRDMANFSNLDLLSDYRLLEEITRTKEAARRDPCMKAGRREQRKMNLRDKVRLHCNIHLRLLPSHFVRAKENSSSWDQNQKKAKWRIAWRFGGKQGPLVHTDQVVDSSIMKVALLDAVQLLPGNEEKKRWTKRLPNAVRVRLMDERGIVGNGRNNGIGNGMNNGIGNGMNNGSVNGRRRIVRHDR